jgi:predicted SAM-dependent methyltransferase
MFGLSKPPTHRGKPWFLNLGCGKHFHQNWINIDFSPFDDTVICHDLRQPLPFPENSCAVVYHSHVLEHFTRAEGRRFIAECFRVLQPQGILRVAVPDLECIARLYLQSLEGAKAGSSASIARHEWMTLELFDQMVREESGGEMGKYWQQNPMPELEFIIARMGQEVVQNIQVSERKSSKRRRSDAFRHSYRSNKFRQSGEVHKWMYDAVSLKRLLEETGFESCKSRQAMESDIPLFTECMLDVTADGKIRKPDSLFMEAWKP